MIDYQHPLFGRDDMSILFKRRLSKMKEALAENGAGSSNLSHKEILRWHGVNIRPIELVLGQADMQPESGSSSRGYSVEVPYSGDAELWQLYPVQGLGRMDGEAFNGRLILTTRAQTLAEAQAELEPRLWAIMSVIDQQKKRIKLFKKEAIIQVKVETLRTKNL
jgi:hypothetical protein